MELTFIIVFAVLAVLGLRLFVVIGALALILYLLADIGEVEGVVNEMYTLATSPVLLTIPLFTFAGYLMAESKTPDRLIAISKALLSPFPGGIAVVALISCAFFTAFTGASGVTIIALGGLLYPVLKGEQFSDRFSLGLLTTSGSLGLLFPPSLALILYGLIAEVSITQLFVAGVLPGSLLIILLALYSMLKGRGQQAITQKSQKPIDSAKIKKALWDARFEIPIPFAVLIGIYGGFLSVTDSAPLLALYVFVIEVFVYRDISLKRIPKVVQDAMVLVGGIFIIICCAKALTYYFVDQSIPQRMLEWMQQYIQSKITFLMVLNIFLLIVGCLMDIFSAILVVVPLIVPIAMGFGIDPLHLGIIFLVNLEMGYSTPPVGLNLFIASFRFKKPIMELYKASLPFLAILLVALILITYWPALSTFLVEYFNVE